MLAGTKSCGKGGGSLPLVFLVSCALLGSLPCSAQPKSGVRLPPSLNTAEAQQKGRELVADLLAQRPQDNSTNTGLMKIRNADGGVSEVRVKFEVEVGSGRWVNIYESAAGKAAPGETLSIVHRDGAPNEYEVSSPPGNPPRKLGAAEIMAPFAGSDFWIADLGLEFLHWPQQMVLKQEMRRSRSCNVLSSVNPHPSPGGYSRVVSWMDIESGGVVLAQAFDAQDKLLKEFAPKEMKKVQGQWQLEEMEIRNLQTGSRTRVQFDLDR